MKTIIIAIIIAAAITSCGTHKAAQQYTLPSVDEKTKVTVKEVLRLDTVFVEIPAQQSERTTFDSVSVLETEYARSAARINTDGTLYHDLKNKPQKKATTLYTPVQYRDSIVYVTISTPVPVKVERELTFWERTSIKLFKYVLPALAVALIWIFRRKLFSFI